MGWHKTRMGLVFTVLIFKGSSEPCQEEFTGNSTVSSDNGFSELLSDQSPTINEHQREISFPKKLSEPVINGNVTHSRNDFANTTLKIHSNCLVDRVYGSVEVVNASRLMELLKLAIPANRIESKNDEKAEARTCLLVFFYARWCIFSSQAAPHFNALPRFYPYIKAVAIDASKYQNFNTQFGIVGVPTLMFMYNGKPLVKFNDTSYTLETFARFVTTHTALEPNSSFYVTSADFRGPLPSTPSNETDYFLIVSCSFIAAYAIYFMIHSHLWHQFVELVQNTWRESNAQHEHVD